MSAQVIEFFLDVLHIIDGLLLISPAGLELAELLALVRKLTLQGGQAVLRSSVRFLLQRELFNLHAADDALELVDFLRGGIDLHAQAGTCFVDKVNGLIRQEAVGDVAIGQLGGRNQRGVHNAHAVMHLVALLQATQNTDGVLHGGLRSIDLLEAALQSGVLFDVLAVLVQGSGAYEAQLATGQHGFDHIAGVHRAVTGSTGADDGVQLVDEGDDLALRGLNLIEHGL